MPPPPGPGKPWGRQELCAEQNGSFTVDPLGPGGERCYPTWHFLYRKEYELSATAAGAARGAGMHTIAVTHSSLPPEPGLADLTIDDYTQLATHFFTAIQQRSP